MHSRQTRLLSFVFRLKGQIRGRLAMGGGKKLAYETQGEASDDGKRYAG